MLYCIEFIHTRSKMEGVSVTSQYYILCTENRNYNSVTSSYLRSQVHIIIKKPCFLPKNISKFFVCLFLTNSLINF